MNTTIQSYYTNSQDTMNHLASTAKPNPLNLPFSIYDRSRTQLDGSTRRVNIDEAVCVPRKDNPMVRLIGRMILSVFGRLFNVELFIRSAPSWS